MKIQLSVDVHGTRIGCLPAQAYRKHWCIVKFFACKEALRLPVLASMTWQALERQRMLACYHCIGLKT